LSRIKSLIEEHSKLRASGINLIASENVLSLEAKKVMASDLAGRYHNDWYGGSKFAVDIIKETEDLAKKVFKVKHAIVTSLSGNMCDLAVMFAFTKPGDKVAMVSFQAGGYPLGVKKFHRELLPLPADKNTFELDAQAAKELVLEEKPPLTILGSSFIPFPHPVKEISESIKDPCVCVYDGSHVLGLIACGKFQDPIKEGAEVLFGSTHKTLYGPQGGLVLSNSEGIALEEIFHDSDYGENVVRNAKALARALDDKGVPVKFKEKGFTESHQIFLDIEEEKALSLCRSLEDIGVFIDIAGRIGLAEVTHMGMDISDMDLIADVISEVIRGRAPDELKSKVLKFAKKFST
jgi:glycine hydroxymethyltransferase